MKSNLATIQEIGPLGEGEEMRGTSDKLANRWCKGSRYEKLLGKLRGGKEMADKEVNAHGWGGQHTQIEHYKGQET
jgi:hypothetical protein